MERLKYYSLNKEERQVLKEEFSKSPLGKDVNIRLKRVVIIGIMLIIYSIYLLLFQNNTFEIVSGISLIIIALLFIIGSYKIKINKLNDFLIKKQKR